MQNQIYICGALTFVPEQEKDELTQFFIDLARLCKEYGFHALVPGKKWLDRGIPNPSSQQVYEVDKKEIRESVFMIAVLDYLSFGVGIELEICNANQIPVLALLRKENSISKITAGCPAIEQIIEYENYSDALQKVREFFEECK